MRRWINSEVLEFPSVRTNHLSVSLLNTTTHTTSDTRGVGFPYQAIRRHQLGFHNQGQGWMKGGYLKGHEGTLGIMERFSILIMVVVIRLYHLSKPTELCYESWRILLYVNTSTQIDLILKSYQGTMKSLRKSIVKRNSLSFLWKKFSSLTMLPCNYVTTTLIQHKYMLYQADCWEVFPSPSP